MHKRIRIAIVLGANLLVRQACGQSPEQSSQQPAKPPAITAQPESQQSSTGTPGNSQASPAKKPRKVFTNEDFDARPHEFEVNGARDLLTQVNSCDRNCFDDVYRRTGFSANSNVKWKQAVLNGVDSAKADLDWQSFLREGLSIQVQSCELQVQKRQDLARFSDPRTVTHSELMVEREYEPKFREITRRLGDLERRASSYISKKVEEPYQAQFMQLQLDRVAHANCQITVSRPPGSDEDNADDDP